MVTCISIPKQPPASRHHTLKAIATGIENKAQKTANEPNTSIEQKDLMNAWREVWLGALNLQAIRIEDEAERLPYFRQKFPLSSPFAKATTETIIGILARRYPETHTYKALELLYLAGAKAAHDNAQDGEKGILSAAAPLLTFIDELQHLYGTADNAQNPVPGLVQHVVRNCKDIQAPETYATVVLHACDHLEQGVPAKEILNRPLQDCLRKEHKGTASATVSQRQLAIL